MFFLNAFVLCPVRVIISFIPIPIVGERGVRWCCGGWITQHHMWSWIISRHINVGDCGTLPFPGFMLPLISCHVAPSSLESKSNGSCPSKPSFSLSPLLSLSVVLPIITFFFLLCWTRLDSDLSHTRRYTFYSSPQSPRTTHFSLLTTLVLPCDLRLNW